MVTDLRIRVRNFIKRNKWKVIVFLIAWAILVAGSAMLANWKTDTPITTYTPHEPIMENGETIPKKWEDDIEDRIKAYITYCNQKEYEKAYEMIREDCRENIYPTLQNFKAYVDYVFQTPKVYTIQNYVNRGKVYIYRVRLFEDILATGMTDQETLRYFEEQMVFTEQEGDLQFAVKAYIGEETLNKIYEDQYMRITIEDRMVTLNEETYTIHIENKTEHTIVLADTIEKDEITLTTDNGTRSMVKEEQWQPICLMPKMGNTYHITFTQFYDEAVPTKGMIFDEVRVLRSYSGEEEKREQELAEAIALYSLTIPL